MPLLQQKRRNLARVEWFADLILTLALVKPKREYQRRIHGVGILLYVGEFTESAVPRV